ncbi:MAG: alpha/beta hydrolase [Planctomycetes bacterium]|nr:alpha/beta hydrolase [Planctomycetota bacterium]
MNALPVLAQTSARAAETEEVKLKTKDGVKLAATFFPSKLGQEAVPIVMLHDDQESRAVFNSLARALQNPEGQELQSHAVLTVDLRGHGESTTQVGRNGKIRRLEADRLRSADYQNMVLFDMEAVRKFLRQKNDAGQLNLNKLCLLGSGMGANVATAYAAYDWDIPPLARTKQGQDVKALILASPKRSFGGLSIMRALKQPGVRQRLSVLLVYGAQDSSASKDTKNIHKLLSKYHKMPPRDQRREKQDLFIFSMPTSLKGTRLLTDPNFAMLPKLDIFLDARLSQQDFEWSKRLP